MQPQILERAEHPISRRNIDRNVLKVLYRLISAGKSAYLVGGGVRDLMLGRTPKDFDIATSAHPHEVRALFRNSRLIGRRFKLVHVFFGPQNIEVATFRRRAEDAVDTDDPLIHHDNTFGTAEEDAFRRDFTVNALFYDPTGFHVIDYTGGVADLHARLIRSIGDPDSRMREDPVRMIRAARFAAKLDFEIEAETRAAIERHRSDLLKASTPRVVEEIYRTVTLAGAERALHLMEQLGLLEVLLPRLSQHLRSCAGGAGESRTAQNVAALGTMIGRGGDPGHELVLACLFLDLYREMRTSSVGRRHQELIDNLRSIGFARGDTDRMRRLCDAFELCIAPSRRTRRLARSPHFAEVREFYAMVAPTYGADPADLMRFLSVPPHEAARATVHEAAAAAPHHQPRRRRRGRRGGRRHRERRMHQVHHRQALPSAAQARESEGNGGSLDAQSHSGEGDAARHAGGDAITAHVRSH